MYEKAKAERVDEKLNELQQNVLSAPLLLLKFCSLAVLHFAFFCSFNTLQYTNCIQLHSSSSFCYMQFQSMPVI